MASDREPTAGFLGLLGFGVAVCCGLPILLGAGVAVGVAGLALGSGVVIAAGVILGTWGWRRRQRNHRRLPGFAAESRAPSYQTDSADQP